MNRLVNHPQQPLPFAFDVAPVFDNFHIGANQLAFDLLHGLQTDQQIQQVYMWGGRQCGKTHLLMAAHQQWLSAKRQSFYIALDSVRYSATLLDDLDGYDLVVLDDIDKVTGQTDWEVALFNLINFCREQSCKLVLSADRAPASEHWTLADLHSRLSWGPVVQLRALSEAQVREAMFGSALARGLQLDNEAADFLLRHYSREVNNLLQVIAILDSESLAAGRARITVPFLKRCLSFA